MDKKQLFYSDYSAKSDILNIHKKGKLVKGSAELGDFTIDFDSNDNIVGVEIMNASSFLKDLEITKNQLENLKDAGFLINQRDPNYTYVYIFLILPNEIEKRIVIPAPIAKSIPSG